ncbi:DoxX family protein [Caulobacter segnis]|uniref:DoxX family protein n=1 Tax=Caulobacter segnis TaxID=88688 RepID=UPI001CBAA0EE|nr:DoxX family protein [Caulobacter segnis]UAL08661.1 DoxX family protein [Caulobacter segnis]
MIRSTQTPRFVETLLDWRPTAHVARLALVSAYLLGAVVKASDFPGAVAEQAHFGMTPPAFWAALTIAVEIIGPMLILTRRWLWLGAGMLGVFTLLAAFKANAFWTMAAGHDRFMATNAFVEHIGLVGGFVLVALLDRRERAA